MNAHIPYPDRNGLQRVLLITGIVFIAINLRPALAGVGPLISDIRADTGLSNALLGLLTTLPLIAFGVISLLTPLFTRRFGIEGTMAWAMGLLTAGILIRSVPSNLMLFAGTLLFGIAIAFGNVLLPSIAKRDFPTRTGMITSLYSSIMGIGAAVAAGLSVPLAEDMGLGWRGSLIFWAVPAIIGCLIWLPQIRFLTVPKRKKSFVQAVKRMGGSVTAWQVALFMGLQSLTFYVILAWLPEVLQDRNLDPHTAGWMLSLSQGTGVLGTLLLPVWAEKIRDQRILVGLLVFLELVSLGGLSPVEPFLVPLWVSLLGFSLGGSFGLSLMFIVNRAADTQGATELSGMAQSVGYLLAAVGPTLFGGFHDWVGGWFVPIAMLAMIALLKMWSGWHAAEVSSGSG